MMLIYTWYKWKLKSLQYWVEEKQCKKEEFLKVTVGENMKEKKNEENGCYSQAWTSAEGAEWSETLESFEP